MTKPIVLIEAWQLVKLHDRPYVLLGYATGHPTLRGDRREIQTSLILSFDEPAGLVETCNTIYRLGCPVKDMIFHPDGSVAQIFLADLVASRSIESSTWSVHYRDELVGEFHAHNRTQALIELLSVAVPFPAA